MMRSYTNALLDLAQHGVLAITLEQHGASLLAAPGGDAVWIDSDKTFHARKELFLLSVPSDTASTEIASTQHELASRNAAASVREHWQWLAARVSALHERVEPVHCLPTAVVALRDGLVLAIYQGVGVAPEIRLIDVPGNQVLWTATQTTLLAQATLPAANPMPNLKLFDICHIAAAGREQVLLSWRGQPFWLQPTREGFNTAPADPGRYTCAGAWWATRSDASSSVRWIAKHPDGRSATIDEDGQASTIDWIGALDAPRMVSTQAGGVLTFQDLESGICQHYRPFGPLAQHDSIQCSIRADGDYALVSTYRQMAVLDIARGRLAPLPAPVFEPSVSNGPDHIIFRPAWLLHRGHLWQVIGETIEWLDLHGLAWEALPDLRARREISEQPSAKVLDILRTVQRPMLGFRSSRASSTSFIGDLGTLPDAVPRPAYQGVPMAMVCQIDLSVVATLSPDMLLPTEGALCVFVSVSADGELSEEIECGSPDQVLVHWTKSPPIACAPPKRRADDGAIPLTATRHPDWPALPSTTMRPFELDELEVEHYLHRAKRKGAGDKPYRIRLGGYPLALQDNDLEIEAARRYAEQSGRQTDPAHWQLLLQLEGEAFMWGTDSGCLYLLIHQEDLQAHRFSEAVWITQGY